MNSDIRISTGAVNHPKTKRLIRILGFEAFYSLVSLWSYAATNKPDGDLTGLDDIDIAIAANWSQDSKLFFDTMCQVKFLDCSDNSIVLHDWADHNPYAAGATDRSSRSRFNKMKSHYPELHKSLSDKGITRLSSDEYQAVVKQYLSSTQAPLKECSSPYPSPTPTPTPTPKDSLKNPKKEKFDPVFFKPDYITEDLWNCLLQNRKFKKLENSELALKTMCNQFELAIEKGFSIKDCISTFVEGKWTRFKADWMENLNKKRNGKNGFQTKQQINDEIQDIGAALNERTKFNPYRILEAGNSSGDADQNVRALPE